MRGRVSPSGEGTRSVRPPAAWHQKWFLQITPTYHFTTDGGRISPLAASAMAGIKRLENNQAVHGQVIMWARRLQQQSSRDARGCYEVAPR